MKDIAILIPCWKSPELLRICIPSLINSITTDSQIIVTLNEADEESKHILDSFNIIHIDNDKNLGPSAVDCALPIIKDKFKYVCNANSDMIFPRGWDAKIIDIMRSNNPCTVSPTLVEPASYSNYPIRIKDNLGEFTDKKTTEKFLSNIKNKKYISEPMVAIHHPITCTMDDFIAVGGYSDNMDAEWIEVHGNALDPYFGYRLFELYNGNISFIRTHEIFVYHGTSLNKVKHKPKSGAPIFKRKTGITVPEFAKKAGINA